MQTYAIAAAGEKLSVFLSDGTSFELVADGRFEPRILDYVRNSFDEEDRHNVILSIFDSKIRNFIEVESPGCLGNKWVLKKFSTSGLQQELEVSGRPVAGDVLPFLIELSKLIIPWQSLCVDGRSRSLVLALGNDRFIRKISAEYDPHSFEINPESIQAELLISG